MDKKTPKIIFEQWQLQIAIGQWLHMDSSQSLEEIVKTFSYVLKQAGIELTETCILKEFDKENFSFDCYLKNANVNTNIELKWENNDTPKELIIHYPQKTTVYQYYQKEKNPILKLNRYTIKNSQNGNACTRILSPHNIGLILQNKEYTLSIKIENPEKLKLSTLILKNEAELQKHLLELSFPIEISEIYKKICKTSIDAIEEYPKFELQIHTNTSKETIDILSLAHGKLEKFMITKKGKTITVDETGEIAHKTPTCTIREKENGEIHYSINIKPGNTLPDKISPLKQYNEIQDELEKAKQLVKTILQDKKKDSISS